MSHTTKITYDKDTFAIVQTEDLRVIVEAAAFQTNKVMREIKHQALVDLISVDKSTGRLDLTKLDSELQMLKSLQDRMCTITLILNGIDAVCPPKEEDADD